MYTGKPRVGQLPFKGLMAVLQRRDLFVPSEVTLLECINSWIEEHPKVKLTPPMVAEIESLFILPVMDTQDYSEFQEVVGKTKNLLKVI